MKKAVIIGVGAEQGLGSQLAKRFASEGLHVFIAGRTLSRVQERASEIEQAEVTSGFLEKLDDLLFI